MKYLLLALPFLCACVLDPIDGGVYREADDPPNRVPAYFAISSIANNAVYTPLMPIQLMESLDSQRYFRENHLLLVRVQFDTVLDTMQLYFDSKLGILQTSFWVKLGSCSNSWDNSSHDCLQKDNHPAIFRFQKLSKLPYERCRSTSDQPRYSLVDTTNQIEYAMDGVEQASCDPD